MNITCVIPTLGPGGAERVITYLAAGLTKRGHQVTVLTLSKSVPDFYALSAGITRVELDLPAFKKQSIWGSFKRLKLLCQALRSTRPNLVINFMTHSVSVACAASEIPFIFGDHLDISKVPVWWWGPLRSWALNRAAAVTVLSMRDKTYTQVYYPQWKTSLVFNPAFPVVQTPYPRPEFLGAGHNIVAMGRLTAQKGFDLLLQSWHKIAPRFERWQLNIIGAGPEEASLKRLVESLGLKDSVRLIPPVQNVAAVYQHTDLYAMSSRTEGFPMVLLEAMSAGLPVVSFDCTGPDAIVRDNIDGYLVPPGDTQAFADQLALLMIDEQKREEFSACAVEVVQRFSYQKFIDAYEALCIAALK